MEDRLQMLKSRLHTQLHLCTGISRKNLGFQQPKTQAYGSSGSKKFLPQIREEKRDPETCSALGPDQKEESQLETRYMVRVAVTLSAKKFGY